MPPIRKIDVAPGVFWIEIPGAELSVLCGCPADAVKHLMRTGLAVPAEKDGVKYETGPNAILLSDLLIQNGALANLAEFPVLQMLYRQGMLLPGHPNNTGRKPLLMGQDSQVRAQLRYIYRGNYGLISKREMLQAGMTRPRAEEEMRLKLRFAFGEIRDSEEFLDTLSVGPEAVEIRAGATIRRLAHNVFEFTHDGQTVGVDLNLHRGRTYPAPYPLGFSNVGREYFAVVHSGDGDGWDYNRPAMAAIIIFQGEVYLVDAGPNIGYSLTALGIGVNEVRGVFHTHAHDDHFCGLTTLMHADHKIEYYATKGVRASVAKKWAALLSRPQSEFEKYFDVHDLHEGSWNNIAGLEAKPMFSPHPVETTVFFFRARSEDGYRTYAHLADLPSRRVLDGFLTDDDSAPGISPRRYERVWKSYLARADIKKIDIGGGLIHGDAEDFKGDPSPRIILSHTSLPLTDRQKEIGSGATFGTVDVLIEGKQDYVRAKAYNYLRNYLPMVREHELRMLMNGELVTVSPETILVRRGERHKDLYLVVTGVVERLDSEQDLANGLSAGALIGELSALTNLPSGCTFRAKTYVRALRLPGRLLSAVLRDNGLMEFFDALRFSHEFLQGTWLFGDVLSTSVQNTLVDAMVPVRFKAGKAMTYGSDPAVYILSEGRAELRYGTRVVAELGPGDFFGEGFVLFDTPCITTAVAVTDTTVLAIHAGALRGIPAVRWKLFESYRNRVQAIVDAVTSKGELFQWREEYATGHKRQDQEHQRLLEAAATVYHCLSAGRDREAVERALERMTRIAKAHVAWEERLYAKMGFADLEHHRELHVELVGELEAKAAKLREAGSGAEREFMAFFKTWLVDHIMTEDRKFGRLIEARGE